MALAGCPSDVGSDGGQTETTAAPDSVGLSAGAIEALSLQEVGRESVEDRQVVGYRPGRESTTLVGEFATTAGPPAGRTVLASHVDIPEISVPVGDAPRVSGEQVGVFVPAGAREGDLEPADLLLFVPGAALGDVTVVNETTRLLGGGETVPASRWLPDRVWFANAGWGETTAWLPSSSWVPTREWVAGEAWVANSDPTAAPVVVPDTGSGVADGYGESMPEGARFSRERALFVVPGEPALPDVTWTASDVFDAGRPAAMGPATAGVAVVAGSDGDPRSLLTTAPGRRAVSLATDGSGDSLEWLADPVRLDQTDHFDPDDGSFQDQNADSTAEMHSYGGIVAGPNGPFAAIAHVLPRESTTVIGADVTPIGSTANFDDAVYQRVFPRSRLHNSRGFTWVAGSAAEQTSTPTPTPTPTATPTPASTPTPAAGSRLECGTQLPSSITEDTVLQRGCQYTVQDEGVQISQGARLAIEPGVEIEVGSGLAINVTEDGALTAQGTEDNPIALYGSTEERGHWHGIEIKSDDSANELSHVDIAHAGGVYWNSAVVMHRTDAAQATIQHCTIRESSSSGIAVTNAGELVDFRNNTIENVSGPPLRLHPNRLGELTGTSTFRNTDTAHILVGTEDNNVTEEATWPAMDLPYQFNSTVSIQAEVDIEPGATLEFQQGGPIRLFVGGDGQLVADASDGDPITFRGVEETPGSWGGIFVRTENDNLLDNVDVRHAGEGYREANIGVGIDDPGSLTIRNSVIGDGLKSGILATNTAEIVEFENNTFENMQGPPLDLHPNRVGDLSGTATFQNNDEPYVLVGSEDNNVTEDATWPAMDVPYQFSTTVSIQSAVDIEAGATLEFRQGGPRRLFVGGDGQLVADASGGDPITFRGVEETPGSWGGLFIRTTRDNLLDNVVVSDGGEGYRDANIGIGIDDPGSLTVQNSQITDSAAWGIVLTEGGTLTEENNTFENNASGDIQRPDG